MKKIGTGGGEQNEAKYSHPGITRLREMVAISLEEGVCKWCSQRRKDKAEMEEHLHNHVLMGVCILEVQMLRQTSIYDERG